MQHNHIRLVTQRLAVLTNLGSEARNARRGLEVAVIVAVTVAVLVGKRNVIVRRHYFVVLAPNNVRRGWQPLDQCRLHPFATVRPHDRHGCGKDGDHRNNVCQYRTGVDGRHRLGSARVTHEPPGRGGEEQSGYWGGHRR